MILLPKRRVIKLFDCNDCIDLVISSYGSVENFRVHVLQRKRGQTFKILLGSTRHLGEVRDLLNILSSKLYHKKHIDEIL